MAIAGMLWFDSFVFKCHTASSASDSGAQLPARLNHHQTRRRHRSTYLKKALPPFNFPPLQPSPTLELRITLLFCFCPTLHLLLVSRSFSQPAYAPSPITPHSLRVNTLSTAYGVDSFDRILPSFDSPHNQCQHGKHS